MPAVVKVVFFSEGIQKVADERIPPILAAIGSEYVNEVRKLMRDSPATGRVYRSRGSKRRLHRASAPGEPPAPDTGDLIKSLRFAVRKTSLGSWVAEAGSTLKKALYLEYGAARGVTGRSGRIERVRWVLFPRPAWRPALVTVRKKIPAIVAMFAKKRRRP